MSTTHPDPESQLDSLVFAVLERFEAEGMGAVDALCEEFPEMAAALRERVGTLEQAGLLPAVGGGGAGLPERLGEFRVIEVLGRGGMGVVYLAEQESLSRRVALKVVRPEQIYFPGARERFLREVQIVAQLAHPGIAPVYAVDQHDGVPYFAMEFVDGVPLDSVIHALRGEVVADLDGAAFLEAFPSHERQPGAVFVGTWQQVCLRLVRQVAEALEHAHRNGVLHRDVKPSNVMLTASGRTRLVDFGLATREGVDRLTRTGSQLGSAPYMPPELIDERQLADAPTLDVYSLGVTLYELLTLTAPYKSDTRQGLFQKIVDGRPDRPRRRNPAISEDAETVCLHAMDPDPARRYQTAEAFARDLTNLLERRPIEARRAGMWLRARRWSQRNPARAVAVGLAALLLVGGPIGFGVQQAAARAEIEKALTFAERNFEAALESVEFMLERVSNETLRDLPHMEAVRRDLLERAISFYERFLVDRTDDPKLLERSVGAATQLSNLLGRLGRYDEGLGFSDRAVAAARQLVAASDLRAHRALLVGALANRAGTLIGRGLLTEARPALAAARSELDALGAPTAVGEQIAAAAFWRVAAAVANLSGESEPAIEANRQEVAMRRAVMTQRSTDEAHLNLAHSLTALGESCVEVAPAEAEAALRESAEVLDQLLAVDPQDFSCRLARAMVERLLATLLLERHGADAESALAAAFESTDALVTEFPGLGLLGTQLTVLSHELGVLWADAGRFADSERVLSRGHDVHRVIYERDVGSPRNASLMAQCHANIGYLRFLQGRYEESIADYERSIDLIHEVLKVAPERTQDAERLPRLTSSILFAATDLEDHERAARAAEDLVALNPDSAPALQMAGDYLALAVATARGDRRLDDAGRERAMTSYAASSIAYLLRALERGADPAEIAAVPDLAQLRGHARWDELSAALGN